MPVNPVTISISGDTLTGFGAITYQWQLNGSAIPGATGNMYIVRATGTYTLQVTDTNGCTATSSPVLITGIDEEKLAPDINIFPNPTTGSWQLTVANEFIGSAVEVYNAAGQLVYKSNIQSRTSHIGTSQILSSGIYELRIISAAGYWVRKLVKE